jgi:hypothetical protein
MSFDGADLNMSRTGSGGSWLKVKWRESLGALNRHKSGHYIPCMLHNVLAAVQEGMEWSKWHGSNRKYCFRIKRDKQDRARGGCVGN